MRTVGISSTQKNKRGESVDFFLTVTPQIVYDGGLGHELPDGTRVKHKGFTLEEQLIAIMNASCEIYNQAKKEYEKLKESEK